MFENPSKGGRVGIDPATFFERFDSPSRADRHDPIGAVLTQRSGGYDLVDGGQFGQNG
jgi:hypothetical protein